jgi:zinc protease
VTRRGAPLRRVCGAALALLVPTLTLTLALALALAGQVAAAGTPDAEPPALEVPPVAFAERTLRNGLQFIAVPNRASPTVSVQVWYHVGAKDDPAGRSGFAHLFEHLMFKRTRYLRAEQFDRLTEDVGGANNAFTSDDVTVYQDIVPSNHLEALLWAEAERMANLDVVQASFESERSVVKEEYRERVLTPPYGRFTNAIASLPYESHPYRRPVIGRIEDLEAATLADVAAFHAAHYRPDNATLVVAGDFDPKQLDAWVDQYFAPVPRPAAPVPRVTATEPAWTHDRRIALTGPRVALPAVALAWLAPPLTSPDVPALRIAAALLSGGESSRLSQSLVYRRQLASQAGFDADLRAGPGLLIATATAAGGKALAAVQAGLLAEVLRLVQRPVPAAELSKVKTQLLTEALLTRQTPEGLGAAVAAAAVLEGGAEQINIGLAALQAVTATDVQRVMRRYLGGTHKVTIEYTQERVAK